MAVRKVSFSKSDLQGHSRALRVGPQGVDRAGADVQRRHVDTCLQRPITAHSALSHQRRLRDAANTS